MALFGLLGRKLGHSWSPQIHSMLFDYDYSLNEVEPEALGAFLQTTDLSGMNVTIPYKKDVMPFCVRLSDEARRIGSVNTLVCAPDGWEGYNTDYFGFVHMLRRSGAVIQGKRAVIFGSGGASLTVKAALRDMGAASVEVLSRNGGENYVAPAEHFNAQIIVNATPAGMYPDNGAQAASLDLFPCCEAVFDLVYNPLKTALLLQAEKRGVIFSNGLPMLVAQAAKSAELFTGGSVADGRIDEICGRLHDQMRNIVLIGMPGCGKSRIARELSRLSGRECLDADREIVREYGMKIPEIFEKNGENGFRRMETQVLSRLCKKSGCIIATGGGCVTREENYDLLRQNGVVVWLTRPLEMLPTNGRPLSQENALSELWRQRRDKYAALADIQIENSGSPAHVAGNILEAVE